MYKSINKLSIFALAALALAPLAKADEIADLKAAVADLKVKVANQQTQINSMSQAMVVLLQKTQYLFIGGKTMYIRGCNVQITNDTVPNTPANGLGNLIIGWNPMRNDSTDVRTGSHFLVMGSGNNYRGDGGIVNGGWNDCSQTNVILNGYKNTAIGVNNVILTGSQNTAKGVYCVIGTGLQNFVAEKGYYSYIMGGQANQNWGSFSGVLTGLQSGVDTGIKYALTQTGYNCDIKGGDYSTVITGKDNMIYGWGKYNVIGTGVQNEIHKSADTTFLADGFDFYVDYDNRIPGQSKDWTYHLMSEGYLFDYSH